MDTLTEAEMESAIVAIVGSIRCIYSMHWTEANTGIVTAHVCGEDIDQTKLAPYRRGQGVCHRHEHGLAGWTPNTCVGPCCS